MTIEEVRLTEFAGGMRSAAGATEHAEAQWLDMTGLVLDDDRRLRAQWPATQVPVSEVEGDEVQPTTLGDGGAFVAGVDRTTKTVVAAKTVGATGRPSAGPWEKVTVGAASTASTRPLCRIPVLDDGMRTTGLLFSAPDATSAPFVLYRSGGEWATKTWENNYPTQSPTDNSMPVAAGVACEWGDYLVLGDIFWMDDQAAPFSAENRARFVNRIWFSAPGDYEAWDPLDVELVGKDSSEEGQDQIVGLFVVEQGLLVFTTEHVTLLRGSPNSHVREELRYGISPQDWRHVVRWPATGTIAWVDAQGSVWQTNGESFNQVDREIYLGSGLSGAAADNVSIAALGDYLVVSSPDSCWVLSSFGPSGAWTRLAYTGALASTRWRDVFSAGSTLYAYTSELGTWAEMPTDPSAGTRGMLNGVTPLRSMLVTRAVPGGGHGTTFWHRHGVRATGSGSLVAAKAYPAEWAWSGEHLASGGLPQVLSARKDFVGPAHGPSLDATFEYEFDGEVTVEGVTLWLHRGRARR